MAEEFIFDVPSSDGTTTYSVSVVADSEQLVVACNCKAGLFGKLCKHKIAVISANMSPLDVSGMQSNWVRAEIGTTLRQSALGAAFLRYVEAESKVESAKKMFDIEKRLIESSMRGIRA